MNRRNFIKTTFVGLSAITILPPVFANENIIYRKPRWNKHLEAKSSLIFQWSENFENELFVNQPNMAPEIAFSKYVVDKILTSDSGNLIDISDITCIRTSPEIIREMTLYFDGNIKSKKSGSGILAIHVNKYGYE